MKNLILNQARVIVTLAANIPAGMEGTVHLAWFDAKNKVPYQKVIPDPGKSWSTNIKGDGNQLKDNKIGLTFVNGTQTLVFSNDPAFTTSNTRKAIVEFTTEYFCRKKFNKHWIRRMKLTSTRPVL